MAEVSPYQNASGPDGSPNNDPESAITNAAALFQEHACQLEAPSSPFPGIPGDQTNVGGKRNFSVAHCTFNVTIHPNKLTSASFQSTSRMIKESSDIGTARPQIQENPTEVTTEISPPSEERKVIIVAPFGSEIEHDSDNGMIMNVWFCWNESNDYQEILKSEHEHGKIILESYDTFAMHCDDKQPSENKIQVSISPKASSSWIPVGDDRKEIVPQNVCLGRKVRCSFRLKKERPVDDDKDHLYLTLTISQSVSEERREVQFLLRKKTSALRMSKQVKTALEDGSCQVNVKGKTTRAFLAAPFVDVTKEVNDDIILSLWICPSDDENILFKNLEKEQKILCKLQLDSPSSFTPTKWDESISAEIKVHSDVWTMESSVQQEMEMFKLINGGRAKFQFLCNATDNLGETDIDIFLRQAGEDTEREFITHPNSSVTCERDEGPENCWNRFCNRFTSEDLVLCCLYCLLYLLLPLLLLYRHFYPPRGGFHAGFDESVALGVLILAKLEHDDETSRPTVTLMLCKMSSLVKQLKRVQNSGSSLLDSYDTCVLTYDSRDLDGSELTVTYSDDNGTLTIKNLPIADIVRRDVITCSFPCNGDIRTGVHCTLMAFGRSSTPQIFKHRFMVNEEKLRILQRLNDQIASYNFPSAACTLARRLKIYIAVPYIDPIRNMSDDVIITVWICSYSRKAEIDELSNEQDIIGRIKLDTDNSFLLVDNYTPIEVGITLPSGWSSDDVTQRIDMKRLLKGYRAKAQFICTTSGMEDENSWVDIDITMRQIGEANETQFLTRKKMATFLCQTQTDAEADPGASTVEETDRSLRETTG